MDATLSRRQAAGALRYKKYKAYQPLTTYWAEAELIVHSEAGTATYLLAISNCEC